MRSKLLLVLGIVVLLLTSCSTSGELNPTQNPTTVLETPVLETPTSLPTSLPATEESSPESIAPPEEVSPGTPPPITLPFVGSGNPYPEPDPDEVGSGQELPAATESSDESGGGVSLEGEVFIDEVGVEVAQEDLIQVTLVITGSLPTPCHQFAYQLGQPDLESQIDVRVFSLYDPEMECAQVLQPFEERIDLGQIPAGSYTILVNGEPVKTIES